MFEFIIGLVKEPNGRITADVLLQRRTTILFQKQSFPLLYCVLDLVQLHIRVWGKMKELDAFVMTALVNDCDSCV